MIALRLLTLAALFAFTCWLADRQSAYGSTMRSIRAHERGDHRQCHPFWRNRDGKCCYPLRPR